MHEYAQLEAYRPAIVGHCYRMLGSAIDAEDAAQEALTRAWKGLDTFADRASMRTWLYRIATNVCLDEIDARKRRIRPFEQGTPSNGAPALDDLVKGPDEQWIEPIATSARCPKILPNVRFCAKAFD